MAHDGVLQAEAWQDEGNARLAKTEFDVANHNIDVAEKYGTFMDCLPRADWANYVALKAHLIAYEVIHNDTQFPDLKRGDLEIALDRVRGDLSFAKVGSAAYISITADMRSLKQSIAFWKDEERLHPEETSKVIMRAMDAQVRSDRRTSRSSRWSKCAQPDVAARTLHAVEPDMPAIAQQQGITGDVQVVVSLDVNSHVTGTRIQSSPSVVLNQAALTAAKESQFQTEIRNCKPVPVDFTYTVQFASQ